jgi:hypothetical protein
MVNTSFLITPSLPGPNPYRHEGKFGVCLTLEAFRNGNMALEVPPLEDDRWWDLHLQVTPEEP